MYILLGYHLVFKVDVKMNQFVCKMEDSMFFSALPYEKNLHVFSARNEKFQNINK